VTVTSAARSRAATAELLVGRLAGAGLLGWMAWIHLHLWDEGYKHVPSIGNLFLLNFIGGVVLAVAVLASPRRYLALAAGAGALMLAGTLVSLILSINVGLLGFHELFNAPFVHLTIWVEAVGTAVLAATALRGWKEWTGLPGVRSIGR
jgi:hypothetical protein